MNGSELVGAVDVELPTGLPKTCGSRLTESCANAVVDEVDVVVPVACPKCGVLLRKSTLNSQLACPGPVGCGG